jgi:hypothetical protein
MFNADTPFADGSSPVDYGDLLGLANPGPYVPTVADLERHAEEEKVIGEASDRSDAPPSATSA